MEEVNKEKMNKKGYCPIEKRITSFRKLPNGKWICECGDCGMTAGQYNKVPEIPKPKKPLKPLLDKFQYI